MSVFPLKFNHRFLVHLAMAFIVSICVITWQAMGEKPNYAGGDGYSYLAVAKDLVDTGVFGDGHFTGTGVANTPEGQGMFFAPLYPALVAAVMMLDPDFYDTASCQLTYRNHDTCGHDFGAMRYVQIALAVLAAFLVWLSAWVVTGRYSMAWLAFVLALLAEAYAYYTSEIMTEILVFPFFSLACLCAVAAFKYKRTWLWLACGIVLGLAALTRPTFLYLFYAAIPVIGILGWYAARKIRWGLLFILGFVLAVSPWVIRNGVTFGKWAISDGYAATILVQRVAYNDMNWKEFEASFIYGLPDFGDSLAEDLFEPAAYERFDYDNPDGFYLVGNGRLRAETLEAAGGKANHLSYLLKHYVVGDALKHVAVTFSLVWRGMWVSKYWGLVAIPVFLGVFVWAVRRKWAPFLIYSIPPWFMLGFHAFTSVNVVRYNLILIPCLSIAVAFAIVSLIDLIRRKMRTNN